MKKKDIIRVGDRVKILRPNIICKWGYDNNLQDTAEEVLQKCLPQIQKFIKQMASVNGSSKYLYDSVSKRAVERVAKGIAYEIVSNRMRDGNVRKLFYKKDVVLNHQEGQIAEVSAIKMVKTGKYYGPTYDWDEWSVSRYIDDSGGLHEEKTHKLLQLNWTDDWIEVIDVEKVYD